VDKFRERDHELKVIEDLIDKIIIIGELIKDISRADSELRSLAGINGWKEEMKLILPPKASIQRVESLLFYLREASDKLETWKQKLEDAEKMYPIWRNRLIKELSKNEGVAVEQISSVPQEWRGWVVKRLIREGKIVEKEKSLFLAKGKSEIRANKMKEDLRSRILQTREKIEDIRQVQTLKEKEKGVLEGIIMKLKSIEDKIELIEDETDYKKLRKEIDKVGGVLDGFIVEVKGGVLD